MSQYVRRLCTTRLRITPDINCPCSAPIVWPAVAGGLGASGGLPQERTGTGPTPRLWHTLLLLLHKGPWPSARVCLRTGRVGASAQAGSGRLGVNGVLPSRGWSGIGGGVSCGVLAPDLARRTPATQGRESSLQPVGRPWRACLLCKAAVPASGRQMTCHARTRGQALAGRLGHTIGSHIGWRVQGAGA